MRLICPNCDAQYEVADEAIPASGRDVQCSACGHGWFHRPPAPLMPALPPAARTEDEDEPEEEAAAPAPVPPPSRSLDRELLAVLREEAAREAEQRRMEVGGAEPAPPPIRPAPLAKPEPIPDIAGLTSTLRPAQPARGGFRTGFVLMILVALALGTLYGMAPRIAQEMPEAAPALRSYVAAADQARLALDRLVEAALQMIRAGAA